jgi:hypothetical protein
MQPGVRINTAKRASSTSGQSRIVSLILIIPSLIPIRKTKQGFQIFSFEQIFLVAEMAMQLRFAIFLN